MNVTGRDGRGKTAGDRDSAERAPRSGGRTVARQGYLTAGTTALAASDPAETAPARSRGTGGNAPRLRVAPPLPVSVPRAPFVALILVVVVGGVLGILMVNTKINENAFRLDRLQQTQASLDVQEQQLRKQVAQYESPGSLMAAANTLGLVPGNPVQIRLPDGRLTGMPQPANGEPAITSQQGTGQ